MTAAPTGHTAEQDALSDAGLRAWLAELRPRALAAGIAPAVYDRTMADVHHDQDVVARDRAQAEFTRPIWDYLELAVSAERVEQGRAALDRHGPLLAAIEARYGVDREIVVAIWGLESAYGTRRGTLPVLRSLATLGHDGRRGSFFAGELVAALTILQAGDATPELMTGSWAGAMGHTQFMPSSYLAHAVDFDGDGRRDIWSDDPTDALASAAAYLRHFGWQQGRPCWVEVRLPAGFDYCAAAPGVPRASADWAALGVAGASGGPLGDHGTGSILAPAGSRGAAFLVLPNFRVLARYNAADAYVIAVGHLADRIGGAPVLAAGWPREDRPLTRDERRRLQERLTAAGFPTAGVDGLIGPATIAAIRSFQRTRGLVPDGYASAALLELLP